MHADEVDVDAGLVRRLLAAQFPEWAQLPIEPVVPRGTDNALYRLGDDRVARLPRTERTSRTLEHERRWLPRLAPHVPLAVPTPLAEGSPGEGYPFTWSVCAWLPGESVTAAPVSDVDRLAGDLADLIAALWSIDPAGGPGPGEHNFFRGEPIRNRDAATRTAIGSLGDVIDADAATAAWQEALRAPDWQRPPVWIHGDLDGRNLLVRDGRLSGVVDWGSAGVGDPACDVMVAWKMLAHAPRHRFRDALAIDDATWERSRGWAVSQAVIALAYYTEETNAVLVGEARRWVAAALEER